MLRSQIREQMSGPDLHVFTLKFHSNFSPKKKRFFHFFGFKKLKKKKIVKKVLCNFSVRTLQCFQKKIKIFFWPRKSEKIQKPQKSAKIAPNRGQDDLGLCFFYLPLIYYFKCKRPYYYFFFSFPFQKFNPGDFKRTM